MISKREERKPTRSGNGCYALVRSIVKTDRKEGWETQKVPARKGRRMKRKGKKRQERTAVERCCRGAGRLLLKDRLRRDAGHRRPSLSPASHSKGKHLSSLDSLGSCPFSAALFFRNLVKDQAKVSPCSHCPMVPGKSAGF